MENAISAICVVMIGVNDNDKYMDRQRRERRI